MASETSNKRAKRKRILLQKAELDRFDSLPWNSSLSEDDPFSLVVGSNELEGGFLSLEEIDEAEYGLQIPKPESKPRKETLKRDDKSKKLIAEKAEEEKKKKRKNEAEEVKKVEGADGTSEGDDGRADAGEDESEKSENDEKKKKRRKKKKTNKAKEVKKVEGADGASDGDDDGADAGEDESEKSENDEKKKKRRKMTKNKAKEVKEVDGTSDETEVEETESEKGVNVKAEKGNKKKKKKKKKKKVKKAQDIEDTVTVSNGEDDVEEELFDDADYYAWNELRLNPLIMKSIHRLGFREPTPIQKACIPAAAHQGKDVVGAAETGSGKTLAFGLPIFQRLLDEREKAVKMEERGEEAEKYAPKGLLRALIITPTRELALQVTEHLKAVSKDTNFRVVPIVGGMSPEKQARLLKLRPEVVVGTPGRLWSLMSGGEKHLTELHSLSFFVLDEADRMIENGHFHELQSIVDMLPLSSNSPEETSQDTENCVTVSSVQRKKRQTFVFSATIALSSDFRKKLKRGTGNSKKSMSGELNSIESLSERAGMRENVAVIDLTNDSIMANKLEESFIECREEDKDAYLYYILSVHGEGRTIVFCTSVAALRHLSSIMRTLGINLWTLHAQMEQRARLKAIDRFRENEHAILLATDVAARGIDIPGVRTVVHYQLPHSADVYVHRSGRTARASAEGCSIALVAPNEKSKFAALCRSFSKESFQRFPLDNAYMPEVMKRLSLARQIDKISRKDSKEKAKNSWLKRNAESIEFDIQSDESDDEIAHNCKQRKATSANLKKLKQELNQLLSHPLQPKTFSKRYWAGAGVTPLLHHQFQEMAKQKRDDGMKPNENKRRKMVVIGQDCVEPLQALRASGQEVHMNPKETGQKRKDLETLRRKRKDEKTRLRDHKRKQRKMLKGRQ